MKIWTLLHVNDTVLTSCKIKYIKIKSGDKLKLTESNCTNNDLSVRLPPRPEQVQRHDWAATWSDNSSGQKKERCTGNGRGTEAVGLGAALHLPYVNTVWRVGRLWSVEALLLWLTGTQLLPKHTPKCFLVLWRSKLGCPSLTWDLKYMNIEAFSGQI